MSEQKNTQERFSRVAENLYRHSSGSYFGLFKVGGKQTRVNLKTKELAEAKRLRDKERERLEKVDQAASRQHLSAVVPEYLKTLEHWSAKTQTRAKLVLKKLGEWKDAGGHPLADLRMTKITATQIETFLNELTEGLSVATRNEYLHVLKKFFLRAVKDRVIAVSPAESIEGQKRPSKIHRATPDLEQVRSIINKIRTQPWSDTREESADFLQFMAGAGVGNAEAAALLVKDVDWKKQEIRLTRVKTRSDYSIPIFPAVEPILRKRTEGREGSEKVFSIADIKKSLAGACRKLGLENYTHRAFRRFFITTALDSGVDPRVVAAWQGHSDPHLVLKVYSKVSQEQKSKESPKVTFTL